MPATIPFSCRSRARSSAASASSAGAAGAASRCSTRDGTLVAGIVAGVLFGIEFLFLYVGLEYTTVARNTLLVNTMPFWVLVGGHFLLGERITMRKLLGPAAGLRRPGRGVFRQAWRRHGHDADRRSAEPRRRHPLGGDQHRHQAVETGRDQRREVAALSTGRCGRRRRPGAAFRRPADPRLQRLADIGAAVPGGLYRCLHLCAVVLAAAALSGVGPVELHLPVAGVRRAVRRCYS